MENLTERQGEILNYIKEYIVSHGYPPTVREIGDLAGLSSTQSVHYRLKKMMEQGLIESDDNFGSPRAIRVPGYEFVKKE